MRSDPEEFLIFRVAEVTGKTVGELCETMDLAEFYGWIEYLGFKAELEQKAIEEAKAKAERKGGP